MEIRAIFNDLENPFSNLLIDYKREQALEQSTCYINTFVATSPIFG